MAPTPFARLARQIKAIATPATWAEGDEDEDDAPDEANTHGLPTGRPIAAELRKWFDAQLRDTLGTVRTIGVSAGDPAAWAALPPVPTDLSAYDGPMARAMTPLVGAYWDESGRRTMARVGLDPDDWRVTDPNTRRMIEGAAFAFSRSTNETTTKNLRDALDELRGEMIAGVVDRGETVAQLTKRVQGVFEDASKNRARTIAVTEASRAVHAAQLESAKQSKVIWGKQLLLSSDACQICLDVKASEPENGWPLAGEMHNDGRGHPDYSSAASPPLHPRCRCALLLISYYDVGLEPPDAGPILPADEVAPAPAPPETAETVLGPRPAGDRVAEARWDQRAANWEAARARPVYETRKANWEEGLYLKDIERTRARIAQVEAEAARLAPEWAKVSARYQEIYDKINFSDLSVPQQKSWEKKLEVLRPEYDRLKVAVNDAPYTIRSLRGEVEYFEGKLAAFRADPKNTKVVDYAGLRARFPDLIPPGPIEERLKAYVLGDAKVAAIRDRAAAYEGPSNDLAAERSAIARELADVIRERDRLIAPYRGETVAGRPRKVPPKVAARFDALQVRADTLGTDLARVKVAQKDMEREKAEAIASVLKAVRPLAFDSPDVPAGMSTTSGPLAPLARDTRASVDEAEAWLATVFERGDTDRVSVRVGEGPGYRAHFNERTNLIQLSSGDAIRVPIHEYGHAIDEYLKTGDDNVLERSLEFLKHRVGDETPVDMKAKFGVGDVGEMGRKDKFDSVYDGSSAYYAGKDYGRTGTEIVSMGLELLHRDPVRFVERDPEWAKYLLGVLDGSLR
jgi:hypothetical protein